MDGGLSPVILGGAALSLYALSTALYVRNLARPDARVGFGATAAAVSGAVLNLAALYVRAKALHSVPYRDLLGSMSLFGFFLAVLNVVLEARHRDRSLGPFLMPAALVLVVVALALPAPAGPPQPELRGSIFALHVTLNMLAYAAFAVACALAALYLVVGRSLKRRTPGAFTGPASRLPSLSYLERANRTSLGVGAVALATGLALGVFWATRVWTGPHPFWGLDPKVLGAFGTLAYYAVVVVRAHRGASPLVTARLSIAGFFLVVFSYTVLNLWATRVHAFG